MPSSSCQIIHMHLVHSLLVKKWMGKVLLCRGSSCTVEAWHATMPACLLLHELAMILYPLPCLLATQFKLLSHLNSSDGDAMRGSIRMYPLPGRWGGAGV